MERKFVLQKNSGYWYAFLKHSFNSGLQKTTMKEYGKEDRMMTTKLWDSQQRAWRVEEG